MSSTIRVAISGGGLAGASLFRALLDFVHLDVHIFESAPTFREAGIAIGFTRNAQAALELLGPWAPQCLERAGAVPMLGAHILLAQGPNSGSMVGEPGQTAESDRKRITSIVQRSAFLHELLANAPQERLHTSKKLNDIHYDDDSLTLHFEDGTTHQCDILIGADGIHSTVRRYVLGKNDAALLPRNTGCWAVMALKPYTEAQASIGDGPVNIEDAREYIWIGDGTYVIHNLLDQGRQVQFVIAAYDKEAESSDRWYRSVSSEEMENLYQDWPPFLRKAVKESEQPAIYLWEHPPARTYVSGPVCIMGDAAHATSPWQASGGGMSIEDTMILSALLGSVKTPTEARKALDVYDKIRRPRTQRIVESSRGTGEIMTGRNPEFGLDLEKMRTGLLPRWDFILDLDMVGHRDEALKMLRKEE
ncbi:hypothetical protein Hte_010438 [Hypoxylon texense]